MAIPSSTLHCLFAVSICRHGSVHIGSAAMSLESPMIGNGLMTQKGLTWIVLGVRILLSKRPDFVNHSYNATYHLETVQWRLF